MVHFNLFLHEAKGHFISKLDEESTKLLFPCIHQGVLRTLCSTHAIPYKESICFAIPLVDLKLVQEVDRVGVRHGGGAKDTRDGESRNGPVLLSGMGD